MLRWPPYKVYYGRHTMRTATRSTHRMTNANTSQLLHKKITGMPFLRHSRIVFISQ